MKCCTIAPLFSYFDTENILKIPFTFNGNISLVKTPEWLNCNSVIMEQLGYRHEQLTIKSQFALIYEYEAESFEEPLKGWTGLVPRTLREHAEELISFASLSLWIAKPSSVGYELVFNAYQNKKNWEVFSYDELLPLLPNPKDANNKLTNVDLILARQIFLKIVEIPRVGAAWSAVRFLNYALTQKSWDVVYLYLWIFFEALFGPENAQEVTYKISQRIAFFVCSDKISAKELFAIMKDSYSIRSKLVHGRSLNKLTKEESIRLLNELETTCRKVVLKIFTNEHLLKIFNSKERDNYLDNLPFA